MKALQELREMIAEKKAGEQDMRVFLVNIIQCISSISSNISLQYYQMFFLMIFVVFAQTTRFL